MVKPVTFIQPVLRNGVGSFLLPCNKIVLRYCNWGGSSKGMREFLTRDLKQFAAANPQIQFEVRKESGHPIVKGQYAGGKEKVICVRNLSRRDIWGKLDVLRSSSGDRLKKYKHPVESSNESVRGIWSPFHVDKQFRFKL